MRPFLVGIIRFNERHQNKSVLFQMSMSGIVTRSQILAAATASNWLRIPTAEEANLKLVQCGCNSHRNHQFNTDS